MIEIHIPLYIPVLLAVYGFVVWALWPRRPRDPCTYDERAEAKLFDDLRWRRMQQGLTLIWPLLSPILALIAVNVIYEHLRLKYA